MLDNYWQRRSKLKYYREIKKLINQLVQEGKVQSILDVGGKDGYFLSQFKNIPHRVVVDYQN